MSSKEDWKPIKEYHGFYEVSSLGSVRSLTRTINYSDGRVRVYPSIVLKQSQGSHGYLMVGLACNGKTRHTLVHRLVADAFLFNQRGVRTINHVDGVKDNNCVSNIEWATDAENMSHAYKLGLNYNGEQTLKTGKKATFFKCSILAENADEKIILSGSKHMRENGFLPGSIFNCLSGRRKTHRGYSFSRMIG